jgi:MPBQ/MSBQ methyltransferase
MLATLPLATLAEEDITDAVAPSIDLEQGFFNVLGHGLTQAQHEIRARRPRLYWALSKLALVLPARKRQNLLSRLTDQARTSQVFRQYNRYLILSLQKT